MDIEDKALELTENATDLIKRFDNLKSDVIKKIKKDFIGKSAGSSIDGNLYVITEFGLFEKNISISSRPYILYSFEFLIDLYFSLINSNYSININDI